MICLQSSACFAVSLCLGFCVISFVSVFLRLCFWCFHISFSLFSPHPLPRSEPTPPRAEMEELEEKKKKKSGPSVRARGPVTTQRLTSSHPTVPPDRKSPTPRPPWQPSPGKMPNPLCKSWPRCYGNQRLGTAQREIHSGEEPGPGGGGEAHLGASDPCPPISSRVMLGKSLNLSEPSLPP